MNAKVPINIVSIFTYYCMLIIKLKSDVYKRQGLERLLEASKDHSYSLLIQMTAFYGLRRSEALGLSLIHIFQFGAKTKEFFKGVNFLAFSLPTK